MAVAGRKPKPDGQRRNRTAPVHEWTEVVGTTYDGLRPSLPERYRIDPETGDATPARWPARTRAWWETVSQMPHCRLWQPSDWDFALDSAEVHARFVEGVTNGTELRIREKLLGTTLDARRDLRIRYVDPPPDVDEDQGDRAGVVNLSDYRDLYD